MSNKLLYKWVKKFIKIVNTVYKKPTKFVGLMKPIIKPIYRMAQK